MNKDVRNGALVMALKRLSSDFEFRSSLKIVRTLRNIGDITVRSSLIDYNFKTSPTLLTSQAKLMAEISNDRDNFYTSSRGVNECNVVVSSNIAELVESCFFNETCIHKEKEVSSISVKLPIENVSGPGIYYFVFQRLLGRDPFMRLFRPRMSYHFGQRGASRYALSDYQGSQAVVGCNSPCEVLLQSILPFKRKQQPGVSLVFALSKFFE